MKKFIKEFRDYLSINKLMPYCLCYDKRINEWTIIGYEYFDCKSMFMYYEIIKYPKDKSAKQRVLYYMNKFNNINK